MRNRRIAGHRRKRSRPPRRCGPKRPACASAQSDCSTWFRAVALRDIGPGRSRPQTPVDAVQHPAIIDPRHATRLVGKQRFVAALRHAKLLSELESSFAANRYPFMSWCPTAIPPSDRHVLHRETKRSTISTVLSRSFACSFGAPMSRPKMLEKVARLETLKKHRALTCQ